VQRGSIKTFKTEKDVYDKEARDESKLKKEVKKAFRDARRELKKDSEMLHQVRAQEVSHSFILWYLHCIGSKQTKKK